jgi:MbtH protein
MTSPFDDPAGRYLVLAGATGSVCLWPAWAAVPAGWSVQHGPDDRAACLERIASAVT